MQSDLQVTENKAHLHDYFVDIEGTVHPWPSETITTEQIVALGGWSLSQGVIEIDRDNNEHTLQPGEVVQLKPGHAFAKKVRFKRG
jgi:Multiubiquitin